MNPHETYRSPLDSRYASKQMRAIWSPQRKFSTWRRLWLALAEAQAELGLSEVTPTALDALRAHLDDIDFEAAARYEKSLRHDVMAHIHALGDVAPAARGIIHLGATSQYVNCNTEVILIRESLELVGRGAARLVDTLGEFAGRHRAMPTVGFTHYQPAQPTTVGKRATVWAYDFVLALEDIEHRLDRIRCRGAKGATGTQASFLQLFDGDATRVERLDELVAEKMGFAADERYVVTGQTYPRLVDAQVINTLAVIAAAVHRCATDIRLLSNRKELDEPFEAQQVGSSAMPHKRNPMRCERATGLARFVMSLAQNPLHTAANQWLERTLDDSANRRLTLPEAFLATDAILGIMHNVTAGLHVYEGRVAANLQAELPFLAAEQLLMAAVAGGADRQQAHEVLRHHSQEAARLIKERGGENDLLDRLRGEPLFGGVDFDAELEPSSFVGRAPEQVDRFLADVVEPIRARYAEHLGTTAALEV
ncbi:MAG: adenylosuccinate lyase [Planctomycetota bacterium]|jgi:adenylosuccinate lyase